MARVTGYVPIADGTAIHLDRELTNFQLSIGRWIIELRGDGQLVVRGRNMPVDVLVVQAEVEA